jgi:hypothetical protein
MEKPATPTAESVVASDPTAPAVDLPSPGADPGAAEPKRSSQVKVHVKGHTRVVSVPTSREAEPEKPAPKDAPAGAASATGGEKKAPAATPGPTSSSGTQAAAAAKTPEPSTEKKDDKPPLSRGWATLLDREAKVTAKETEIKPLLEAKEIGKTSKLKAIEKAFGWTLDDLQLEYVNGLEGSETPARVAERTTLKLLEDRKKADDEAAEKTAREATEKLQQETAARVTKCQDDVFEASKAIVAELPATVAAGKFPIDIIRWWASKHNELPTDMPVALRAYEEHLQQQLVAQGFARATAQPAAPVTTTPEKQTPAVRVKTSPTITPEDNGEVPIRRSLKKESAMERAERLLAERSQSRN